MNDLQQIALAAVEGELPASQVAPGSRQALGRYFGCDTWTPSIGHLQQHFTERAHMRGDHGDSGRAVGNCGICRRERLGLTH